MNEPGASPHPLTREPPHLVPRPRAIRLLGGRVHITPGTRPEIRTRTLPPQAYRLSITEAPSARVVVEAFGPAGERHALSTLAQLHRQYGPDVPALEIDDAPAIANRGVMLDVSRCRVPTMDELHRTVTLLAALKFNHLQLYTEHTFAYAGHEDIWRGSDPLTPSEVRTLDGWCREAGITLAANQNCFGHLRRWLRHPRYAPLAETHGPFRFLEWDRLGPHSLCPHDPGSLRLVEDWLHQLLPCFSAGLVNLGCDETFDVGFGRSRAVAERIGTGAVRLGFVARLCDAALRRGARPMFWGDMLAAHREHAGMVPAEAVALMWGYEPDIDFEALIDAAQEAAPGRECWVCPGTSSWLSIFGRPEERTINLRRAAWAAARRRAAGFMVCDWGDQGHRQQWPITLRALADAAEAAWTGVPSDPGSPGTIGLACPVAASLHLFGDATGRVATALDALGACDAGLRAAGGGRHADGSPRRLKNASALYRDMHTPLLAPFPSPCPASAPGTWPGGAAWTDPAPWLGIEIPDSLVRSAASGLAPGQRAEVELTLDTALFARDRAIARRTGLAAVDADRLAARMDDLLVRGRATWRARSREGGRLESERFDQRVRDELGRVAADPS